MDILNSYYSKPIDPTTPAIMIGEVINANDPQQMGRIQVHILSQSTDRNLRPEISQYPWVSYGAPFGGIDSLSTRGPNNDISSGPIAYGWWAIPKVGARVLICAINNDPNQLYWFGCVYPNSTPHTLPHGRYTTRTGSGSPEGPLTTTESQINPLYDNQTKAFGDRDNYEWRSRGSDYQAAGATKNRVDDKSERTGTLSEVHDDYEEQISEQDGNNYGGENNYRQGYAKSRIDPDKDTNSQSDIDRDIQTEKNLESSVVSMTSPGFHSISMDDREENCRTRWRSSAGHQIILDDSNERIYISTSEGRNWVEMDADGHIYVFSEESISMRAEGDLNLTADNTVRITGKKGVHVESEEIRLNSTEKMHIKSKDMYTHTSNQTHTKSDGGFYLMSGTDAHIHVANMRIKTDSNMHSEINGTYSINSTNVKLDNTGNQHLNGSLKIDGVDGVHSAGTVSSDGDVVSSSQSLDDLYNHTHDIQVYQFPISNTFAPSKPYGSAGSKSTPSAESVASDAEDAQQADQAYWTNIVPHHEPWARTFIKQYESNTNHDPELDYDDPSVGRSMKKVRDTDRKRGKAWHR